MGVSRTYSASVLVLRKRKLGEADLILSMLGGDGSLVEAVAKGARKPTSTFATRLDLFCESEVLLARGRNLDIASEVRLLNSHDPLRSNVAATYAAAPIIDCIAHIALPNLPVEHLYAMSTSALAHMDHAPEEQLPSFTAAFLIKLFALLGVRPVLDHCISCGASFGAVLIGQEGKMRQISPAIQTKQSESNNSLSHFSALPYKTTPSTQVSFSFADGGYVCDNCGTNFNRVQLERETLQWARVLLSSTFDEIMNLQVPLEASFAVLHFANRWLRETQNINSKALNQLLTCRLFSL